MVTINISDEIARRLKVVAQLQHRSMDDVAAAILEQHISETLPQLDPENDATDEALPGSLAAFVKAAQEAGFHGKEIDVADRSREILDTEFAEHLRRRMEQSNE